MPKKAHKQLRGENLKNAVKIELERMIREAPEESPISITSVANRVGISRVSLYKNNLNELIEECANKQKEDSKITNEKKNREMVLVQQIDFLRKENEELNKKLNSYIQKWVTIEYNARMNGIDPDMLFEEMPKPSR